MQRLSHRNQVLYINTLLTLINFPFTILILQLVDHLLNLRVTALKEIGDWA